MWISTYIENKIPELDFDIWVLQNNFIPNPRQISKFEPDVFTSRYKIQNNF